MREEMGKKMWRGYIASISKSKVIYLLIGKHHQQGSPQLFFLQNILVKTIVIDGALHIN